MGHVAAFVDTVPLTTQFVTRCCCGVIDVLIVIIHREMHLELKQYASAITLMASVSSSLSIMRRAHVGMLDFACTHIPSGPRPKRSVAAFVDAAVHSKFVFVPIFIK